MSHGLQRAYIRCATPGCDSWIWATRWNSPNKACAQCQRNWESSWQWNGYDYTTQHTGRGNGSAWGKPLVPKTRHVGKGPKGAEIWEDGDEPMDCPTPPWQTTAQQLLEAPNTDMPEEVRLSLQKALQAEQAKQQETKEPTKAEATERFQKATSQLKKAGQAKAQAEQRLAKAKEQVAQLETKLQDATEGLTAAETEVEESSKVYWKYALGLPKDAEDLAEGHAIQGDENLIHLILADMGSKLRPEQQQRLLDMAGGLRDQKRRKTDEAMPLAPDGAKVEANQESG